MLWHIRADQTHLRHINNIYKYLYLWRDCGIVQLLPPDTGRPYFVTLFVATIKPTRLRPSFFPLLIVFRGLQNLAVSLTVQLFSFAIYICWIVLMAIWCVCPIINIYLKFCWNIFPKIIFTFSNIFPQKILHDIGIQDSGRGDEWLVDRAGSWPGLAWMMTLRSSF